jgi:hypothetical protein
MKQLIIYLVLTGLTSCTMEPPNRVYRFNIVNKSSHILIIESQICDNILCKEDDTLKPNQIVCKESCRFNNLNYHDTLIKSFFKKLSVTPIEGKLKIDLFVRKNWVDSTQTEDNLFVYSLIIYDDNIEPN